MNKNSPNQTQPEEIVEEIWFRKKGSNEVLDRSKTLKQLGISRYYDQLLYSYPSLNPNGELYIDFKFLNGKIHRFFIEKKEITFNELLDTIIKDNQYLFKNIKTSFYLDSNF